MNGFKKDKSPREMVEEFRAHLAEWGPENGRLTYQSAAEFLKERGCKTARGYDWNGSTLYIAMQRYGVGLRDCVDVGPETGPSLTTTSAAEVNRRIRHDRTEELRASLVHWASTYTLKFVPTPGKVAAFLNQDEVLTITGKQWVAANVTNALITLGFSGDPQELLESTGWVKGEGRTKEDLLAYEIARRKEALRPHYEHIRDNGIDINDPRSPVSQQVSFLRSFEGIDTETAILRHFRVPAETMGLVELFTTEV